MSDLETQERERNRAMIEDPMSWPLLVLPMKNSRVPDEDGFPRLGYITAGMTSHEGTERVIHLGPMYAPNGETEAYQDVDALLDAGWVVD